MWRSRRNNYPLDEMYSSYPVTGAVAYRASVMEHCGGLKGILDEGLRVCVCMCVFIGVSLCIRFCVFNVSSEDQTQVLIACTANTFLTGPPLQLL